MLIDLIRIKVEIIIVLLIKINRNSFLCWILLKKLFNSLFWLFIKRKLENIGIMINKKVKVRVVVYVGVL